MSWHSWFPLICLHVPKLYPFCRREGCFLHGRWNIWAIWGGGGQDVSKSVLTRLLAWSWWRGGRDSLADAVRTWRRKIRDEIRYFLASLRFKYTLIWARFPIALYYLKIKWKYCKCKVYFAGYLYFMYGLILDGGRRSEKAAPGPLPEHGDSAGCYIPVAGRHAVGGTR